MQIVKNVRPIPKPWRNAAPLSEIYISIDDKKRNLQQVSVHGKEDAYFAYSFLMGY